MADLSVEQIIRDAVAEGKFDGLAGTGRPLPVPADPDFADLATRILKDAGYVPEWVELATAIDREIRELEAWLDHYAADREARLNELRRLLVENPPTGDKHRRFPRLRRQNPAASQSSPATVATMFNGEWEAALAAYARRLHELNRKIARFNALVPVRRQERRAVCVADALDRFVTRFPQLDPAAAEQRELRSIRGEVNAVLLDPGSGPASERRARSRLQMEALERYHSDSIVRELRRKRLG